MQLIPILFCITFLSFAMMRIAGSDAVTQKMENTGMALSKEALAAARSELGLDKPFLVQYLTWLNRLCHGNMGKSYISGRDVFATFLSKLPATMLLTVASGLLSVKSAALTAAMSSCVSVWLRVTLPDLMSSSVTV